MRKGVRSMSCEQGVCVCVSECERERHSLGLRGGLKWIPSRRPFHIPPARAHNVPLSLAPWHCGIAVIREARAWLPPTFSFIGEMLKSCYLVSLFLPLTLERSARTPYLVGLKSREFSTCLCPALTVPLN